MLEDGVGWLDEKFKESEEMVGWGSIGSLRTEWVQGSGEKRDWRERSMQVGGEGSKKKSFLKKENRTVMSSGMERLSQFFF